MCALILLLTSIFFLIVISDNIFYVVAMEQLEKQTCPLCNCKQTEDVCFSRNRHFFKCGHCGLIFVPPNEWLSAIEERARYDCHENSPLDSRYVDFLRRLFIPVSRWLHPGQSGLDFGCGPGPALHLLFEDAGYAMQVYDAFYFPNKSVWLRRYDFITASEVIEHLHRPRMELDRLWASLEHQGVLGVMTKFVPDKQSFDAWHYKNDDTHVCFYSTSTFEYLAQQWDARLTFEPDVAIFKKQRRS